MKTDAIVSGFAKSKAMAELSLAPLCRLQRDGVLRKILCVTWDDPTIDDYADWVGALTGITVLRIPQPQLGGSANRRGIQYQIEQLRAGLESLPDAELILKLRPDFVVDCEFLRDTVAGFISWGSLPSRTLFGVTMPKSPLRHKIWIPWADCNQPFYYEDAAFLGERRDVAGLVTKLCAQDLSNLEDESCGSLVHAIRFAKLFLHEFPLFARYLAEYRFFKSDIAYRRKLVPYLLNDGFFWHLLIAHAWILQSHFHVDAGRQSQLRFSSNRANPQGDWSRPDSLKLANPYDNLEAWRAGTHPEQTHASLQRMYGRLVDNDWQRRLFAEARADFPQTTLARILKNVANCRDGRLKEIEDNFYRGLAALDAAHTIQADFHIALASAI